MMLLCRLPMSTLLRLFLEEETLEKQEETEDSFCSSSTTWEQDKAKGFLGSKEKPEADSRKQAKAGKQKQQEVSAYASMLKK